jgi:uncharacterized damage-inducible protein DinB
VPTSPCADAFGHHVWATARLIDACSGLTNTQLDAAVPGIYGSIIDTLRHLVGSDSSYLFALSAGRVAMADVDGMGLTELRAVMEANGQDWAALIEEELDPTTVVVRRRSDGSESHAPAGIRLAQALHHGTDHRSQVCTALTGVGVEPPPIDVWDYAEAYGRLVEIPPSG